ncbi:ras association domain-containing protein 6 [Hemicordylus capensis]|uniref:ras association domain-containing protein 6 n=1 Tax=Hemicordylus capensis TaxID=884348 RepID=UPI00230490FC|nr:ras association domain-containing protein 6 [Hemicordylus capensis]XP_053116458.1 ras association domain-containing protein 6 [Hemicordylus capensis]XP_053116459.1 ras association domain-containing protein 6 [Hemicordylus capensis]
MKKVEMKSHNTDSPITINEQKHITREQLNSLLDTYNYFYADQKNLQLQYVQTEGSSPVIEGVLNVFWGVQHPIRLKIQDEQYIPQFQSLKKAACDKLDLFPDKRRMIRWGEFDNLYHISGDTSNSTGGEPSPQKGAGCAFNENKTQLLKDEQNLNSPFLQRTMSAAAAIGRKREKLPTIARKEENHRFSINRHFYNYQTSIFTPLFGSATKIRISSNMSTSEVIQQLLQKFKIENSPPEFALYMIHASGEKKQLKSTDIPLLERILQGPSEKVVQFFLMDQDAEEVSSDVAQYIQFPLPLLESILHKLNEEEEREIQETAAKYHKEKAAISQHLHSRTGSKTETTL